MEGRRGCERKEGLWKEREGVEGRRGYGRKERV